MSARNYPKAQAERHRHMIRRCVEANRRHLERQASTHIKPNSPASIAQWWKDRGR
jgi:hypothetical protein